MDGQSAKLTLTGGSITNDGIVGVAKNGGEIVITSGTYTSNDSSVFFAQSGGKITINGGTLSGYEGAIATDATSGNGSNVITINGGTLEGNVKETGYEAVGVYIANNDTFVMNGGSITANGGTGICMRGGDVTINDGSITATGTDKDNEPVTDGYIGDTNTTLEGVSAIVFDETSNYPGSTGMSLSIDGGTITGVDHSIHVLSSSDSPNVYVTGGTLSPVYPEVVDEGNVEEPAQP